MFQSVSRNTSICGSSTGSPSAAGLSQDRLEYFSFTLKDDIHDANGDDDTTDEEDDGHFYL